MDARAPVGRIYRMVWWFRLFAALFLVIGGLVGYGFVHGTMRETDSLKWTTILGAIALSVSALYLIAKAFTSIVEFSGDSITMRWIFYTRSLEYSRIRGRREFVVQGEESTTRYFRLETKDGSRPFDVGKNMYGFDEQFWEWYRSLPDLDAVDKARDKGSGFGQV